PEMMELFKAQAERFGTQIHMDEITKVDFSTRPFTVWQRDKEWKAQSIIIATGASAKLLDIPSEKKLMGHGVSACATCDGFFFKGKEIAVVGGGDTAMEEASVLPKCATNLHVLLRRDELRASKIMQDRAKRNAKIKFV